MEGRTGPHGVTAIGRPWSREWTSFSARFILVQAGGERIALKLGTNWEGGTVAYVAEETSRVSRSWRISPRGGLRCPGVLGVAANPPAMALEYFEGTPLFEALPRLESRIAWLCCGPAARRSEHFTGRSKSRMTSRGRSAADD
jgi:hypothetical protein